MHTQLRENMGKYSEKQELNLRILEKTAPSNFIKIISKHGDVCTKIPQQQDKSELLKK